MLDENTVQMRMLTEEELQHKVLLNDEQLTLMLSHLQYDHVTKESIEARISGTKYTRLSPRTTLCLLTLDNGYEVVGFSACVDERNYDEQIGRKVAYEDAITQLWPLFGFLLSELKFRSKS